jgi:hypothetical protein
MIGIDCDREDDVLAAVNTGRWPDRADAELLAHVAGCAVCRDVVAVVGAFSEDAGPAPRLPDASVVWLRSQMRARIEATRLAERPITVVQAVAFASVVGVLGAVLGASSSWLRTALQWVGESAQRLDPRGLQVPTGLTALMAEHLGVSVAIAVALMVMPVAVYWAMRDTDAR